MESMDCDCTFTFGRVVEMIFSVQHYACNGCTITKFVLTDGLEEYEVTMDGVSLGFYGTLAEALAMCRM